MHLVWNSRLLYYRNCFLKSTRQEHHDNLFILCYRGFLQWTYLLFVQILGNSTYRLSTYSFLASVYCAILLHWINSFRFGHQLWSRVFLFSFSQNSQDKWEIKWAWYNSGGDCKHQRRVSSKPKKKICLAHNNTIFI